MKKLPKYVGIIKLCIQVDIIHKLTQLKIEIKFDI